MQRIRALLSHPSMADRRAPVIRDLALGIAATIQRLTSDSSLEDDLRFWMRSDSNSNIDRSLMEGVLTNAMSGATEESLQSLHSHRDTDPTHYVGWDPSRLYAVHRSLLSLSFLLWDIRVNSIHFDAEELMKTLRETRQVLDAAHFSARSYPLAYNGRIEYVRSSLQAILVSANLMRPPPQWLRRYLRNRGYPGLPALKLVGFATIQERECGICMVEYSQELGNEIVHLPCDERHSASGSG